MGVGVGVDLGALRKYDIINCIFLNNKKESKCRKTQKLRTNIHILFLLRHAVVEIL